MKFFSGHDVQVDGDADPPVLPLHDRHLVQVHVLGHWHRLALAGGFRRGQAQRPGPGFLIDLRGSGLHHQRGQHPPLIGFVHFDAAGHELQTAHHRIAEFDRHRPISHPAGHLRHRRHRPAQPDHPVRRPGHHPELHQQIRARAHPLAPRHSCPFRRLHPAHQGVVDDVAQPDQAGHHRQKLPIVIDRARPIQERRQPTTSVSTVIRRAGEVICQPVGERDQSL